MTLTHTACLNAKAQPKPYKKGDTQGLYLHVMPTGAKYWRMKYRFLGKEKILALGVFPEILIAEAREQKDAARKLLKSGLDPALVRKQKKHTALLNSENTFQAVAMEWHEKNQAKWSVNYAKNLIHRLTLDIFPIIGDTPIDAITAPHLLSALNQIQKRGAIEIAHRLMQTCGQIFRYGIATGRNERNPAADLKGALQPVRHVNYPALSTDQLPEFLKMFNSNDARLLPHTRNALNLLLLTFVRTSELINATWEEFDLVAKKWTIPAHRMKTRKEHIVPLSQQAIEVLERQKALTGHWHWLFPNRIKPSKPMSNNAILKALDRMGYKGRMTGHGFRALAMSTIKEKLNYRHEVVDRQLAHAPKNKVDAAYDRAKFLDERAKMLQDWANYIDNIPNKIIHFQKFSNQTG